MKHLLTKLRGDETWIPCGDLTSEIDNTIFDTESVYNDIIQMRLHTDSTDNAGQILANGGTRIPRSFNKRESTSQAGAPVGKTSTNGALRVADEKSYSVAGNETKFDPLDSTGVGAEIRPDTSESTQQPKSAGHDRNTGVPGVVSPPGNGSAIGNEVTSIDEDKSLQVDDGAASSAADTTNLDKSQSDLKVADKPPEESLTNQDQPQSRAADKTVESVDEVANIQIDQDITLDATEGKGERSPGGPDGDDTSQPVPHRMTTRAQAQAASEKSTSSRTRSASPASWHPPSIHPLYLMPLSAQPDRDFGLPPGEAEETRRVVTLYVQKQEEVCRGAEKLYVGLLRANRMRKEVLQWCKAEGHVGEMSDGEDWYDKEEWGLDEDLRKGHEDEEDDTTTQGKKKGKRT